jgi:hypothetical protein
MCKEDNILYKDARKESPAMFEEERKEESRQTPSRQKD